MENWEKTDKVSWWVDDESKGAIGREDFSQVYGECMEKLMNWIVLILFV